MRSSAKYVWLFLAIAFVGVFLFAQTSGLLGRAAITPTTAVAVVNGREILYNDYVQQSQNEIQQQQQSSGRSLSEDECEGDDAPDDDDKPRAPHLLQHGAILLRRREGDRKKA